VLDVDLQNLEVGDPPACIGKRSPGTVGPFGDGAYAKHQSVDPTPEPLLAPKNKISCCKGRLLTRLSVK